MVFGIHVQIHPGKTLTLTLKPIKRSFHTPHLKHLKQHHYLHHINTSKSEFLRLPVLSLCLREQLQNLNYKYGLRMEKNAELLSREVFPVALTLGQHWNKEPNSKKCTDGLFYLLANIFLLHSLVSFSETENRLLWLSTWVPVNSGLVNATLSSCVNVTHACLTSVSSYCSGAGQWPGVQSSGCTGEHWMCPTTWLQPLAWTIRNENVFLSACLGKWGTEAQKREKCLTVRLSQPSSSWENTWLLTVSSGAAGLHVIAYLSILN